MDEGLAEAHRKGLRQCYEALMSSAAPLMPKSVGPGARKSAPKSRHRALRALFAFTFPLLVLAVFLLWVQRQGFVDSRRCMYGAAAAYPGLLWGSIRFMFGKKGTRGGDPKATLPPFFLAAIALTAGVVSTKGLPINRTPTGWSAKVPYYPGVLISEEACGPDECAATFHAARSTSEGAKHLDRYDIALLAAKVPAQGWPATCPSLGPKCRIYAVAGMRLIECFDQAEQVVQVRYGSQPCPDGESERDAGTSY